MPSSWKPPTRFACSTPSATRSPDTATAQAPAETWLALLTAAVGGSRRWPRALSAVGGAEALLSARSASLRQAGLSAADIQRLRSAARSSHEDWREWLAVPGHGLVTIDAPGYPARLAEIADPPLALWVLGEDHELLTHPQLAVIGSRNPTHTGSVTAEDLAGQLSASGITITSGLALGIDAASHRGGLRGAGSTIAVLGCGIDRVYPQANSKLAAEIRRQGLIVSEYGPGHGIHASQFPQRNRIIAALSLGALVVEATRRSGSLITARLAAEYGREVFALPGSIHSALSKGCHKLIRDGAKLVDSVGDILIEIAPQLAHLASSNEPDESVADAGGMPDVLRDRLDFAPISFDSLVSATGLTAGELSSMLLHLELQGKIEALPGGRYCRLVKRA